MDQTKIIQGCVKKDPKSQRDLVHQYAPVLTAICKRYAPDAHLAYDCLQESFIKIFKYIDKFENKGSFEGWLKKITIRTCLSYRKSIKPVTSIDNIEYSLENIELPIAISKLNEEALMKIIRQLSETYYLVFTMHALEGYSHKEIGEILGLAESSSRSILTRARVKLIDLLKRQEIFEMESIANQFTNNH